MYFKDLDGYTDRQIESEYIRRKMLVIKGCCTYCELSIDKCNCKMKNQDQAIGFDCYDYCFKFKD